jgi:hypothetical protein
MTARTADPHPEGAHAKIFGCAAPSPRGLVGGKKFAERDYFEVMF